MNGGELAEEVRDRLRGGLAEVVLPRWLADEVERELRRSEGQETWIAELRERVTELADDAQTWQSRYYTAAEELRALKVAAEAFKGASI